MPSRRDFLQTSFFTSITASLPPLAFGEEIIAASQVGWVKSQQNPMLSLGGKADFDRHNIFAPAVTKEGKLYYLYYSGGPSGPANGGDYVNYQLGLALSDDGIHWRKTGKPLLPLGERDNFHATPALLRNPDGSLHKINGKWQMVFCGNRADDVELAVSSDGLHWEKDSRSPIYRKAYSPNLLQLGDEVRMYYIHKPAVIGNKKKPWEIHLATGPNLYSLKPHPGNPVIKISQTWETGALFYPYVVQESKTWVMFYGAYWASQADRKTRTAIGMATSDDGIRWTKSVNNPVVTPTPGSTFDSRYNSSQSIIRDGDHYKLYYGARKDMVHKYFAIGLATHNGSLLNRK